MSVLNESQRFTQWWLHLISLMLLAFLGYTAYKWFVLKEFFGNVSPEDQTGQVIVIATILFSAALIYIFRLKTTIDEIGIHYQFIPINLSRKTIRWSELKKCYVRTYKPIKEYGGWGYRAPFGKNKAVNIKGDKGIQLEFNDGKKLLIGTQQEAVAQDVIERYFKISNE